MKDKVYIKETPKEKSILDKKRAFTTGKNEENGVRFP
jgi:hypothetical protein